MTRADRHGLAEWARYLLQAAILGLAIAFVVTWIMHDAPPANGEDVVIRMIEPDAAIGGLSYADAVQSAAPSVVNIYANKVVAQRLAPAGVSPAVQRFFGDRLPTRLNNVPSLGSGVIVSANGYILTNHHVVQGTDEIQVVLYNDQVASARVIGTAERYDLAVLKIEAENLPAATFTSSSQLRVGDVVLAIGNPFGIGQAVTMGIVSATGRYEKERAAFEGFIQTDAAINAGNSGGALVNTNGHLVGINTAIFRESGAEGVGFAIPSDLAAAALQRMMDDSRLVRQWLGVAELNIRNIVTPNNTVPGIELSGVAEGGTAARAGLQDADIITQFGGLQVASVSDLRDLIAAAGSSQAIEILGVRGNQGFRTQARPTPADPG